MKTLNEAFLQVRENLKLTQIDFAKKIGVSRSTIAKIENKEIDVSKKNVFNLWQNFPEQVDKYDILKNLIPKQDSGISFNVKKQIELLTSIYKKNIEDIEYYNTKIKSTVSMLTALKVDLTDYNILLELLDSNLLELKETYNTYLVYSLISNDQLIRHPKVYNEVQKVATLNNEDIEKIGENILETYKTTFDKIFDLLNLYINTVKIE
jgi:DNA-binding XRE family transcriptional regulator